MDDLAAVPQEDGSILLVEAGNRNNVIFSIEAPYMYDANGEMSLDVEMTLANGVLTVIADAAWMNSESRAWPIVIDPTYNTYEQGKTNSVIKDTCVRSDNPGSNYVNDTKLKAGTDFNLIGDNDINRIYVNFDLEPVLPAGSKISFAQFELRKVFGGLSSPDLTAYDLRNMPFWEPNDITWATQPTSPNAQATTTSNYYRNNPATPSLATDSGAFLVSTVYRFMDIKSAVENWETSNKGIVITTPDETCLASVTLFSTKTSSTSSAGPDYPVLWFGYEQGNPVTVQNGENGTASANPADAAAGTEITLTANPNSGYQFKEWQVINGGVTITNNKFVMPANGVTVKAVFERITRSVTYYANGGIGIVPTETKKASGATFVAASAEGLTAPAGKQFKQWNTNSTGTGATYAAGATVTMPASELTLYAVWENTPTYAVTYYSNGANVTNAPGPQTKTYGQTLYLSNTKPINPGYNFQGWATSSTGSVAYQPNTQYTQNAPLALYAVWQANTYTISYSANGGSGSINSQSTTYGQNPTLSGGSNFERADYTLVGWSRSPGTSNPKHYELNTAYAVNTLAGDFSCANTNEATMALYSVWAANTAPAITSAPYTAVIHGTGGTFPVTAEGTPSTITYGLDGIVPTGVDINSVTGEMTIDANTAEGTYNFTITASNGILPDASQSFTLTVSVEPAITGPDTMKLTVGYKNTSVGIYTVNDSALTIQKTAGDARITWNTTTNELVIESGLGLGSYPVTLSRQQRRNCKSQLHLHPHRKSVRWQRYLVRLLRLQQAQKPTMPLRWHPTAYGYLLPRRVNRVNRFSP